MRSPEAARAYEYRRNRTAKRREQFARYDTSVKGRMRRLRFSETAARRASMSRYDTSVKGKLRRLRYKERKAREGRGRA